MMQKKKKKLRPGNDKNEGFKLLKKGFKKSLESKQKNPALHT